MAMADLQILAPNYMGEQLTNTGLSDMVENRGFGVREALNSSSQGMAQRQEKASPGSTQSKAKNDLRVAKAREFGKPKTQVGF